MKDNTYKWIAGALVGVLTVLLVAGINSVSGKLDKTEYYNDQVEIKSDLQEIKRDIKMLIREGRN